MTSSATFQRRLALALLRHAAWVSPPQRADWCQAMTNELDHIPESTVVRWALGCTLVTYMERAQIMTHAIVRVPRWLLTLEMLLCLVPVTLLFAAVVSTAAQGRMTLGFELIAGSATLVGPVGLAVAARLLFFAPGPVSRVTTVALAALSAWTVVAYIGQIAQNGPPPSQVWREVILIALLPALAVAHLTQLNQERQVAPATV